MKTLEESAKAWWLEHHRMPPIEMWTELAEKYTTYDICELLGATDNTVYTWGTRTGIKTLRRCLGCREKLTPDMFWSSQGRFCHVCLKADKPKAKTRAEYAAERKRNGVDECKWESGWARKAWGKPDGLRGCFRVQGQWSNERDYGGFWWWWGEYE